MTRDHQPTDDWLTRSCRDVLAGRRSDDPEQERLRAQYLDWIDANARPWSRSCAGSHLTASSLIVDPDSGRVALVFHGKARLWLQTGGHIEPDDHDPAAAALREASEESGLRGLRVLDGPTRLSRHPAPCGSAEWHLDVQYTVITTDDVVLGRSAESDTVEWFAPDALPTPTDDAVRLLVRDSLRRLRDQTTPAQPSPAQPSPTQSSRAGTPAASDQPSR